MCLIVLAKGEEPSAWRAFSGVGHACDLLYSLSFIGRSGLISAITLTRRAVAALPWASTLLRLLMAGLTRVGWLGLRSLIPLAGVWLIWLIHLGFSLQLPAGHFVRFRDADR